MLLSDYLTIVVCTYNRHNCLARLYEYASTANVNLIIADGSPTTCELPRDNPLVRYFYMPSSGEEAHYPQGSLYRRLSSAFSAINTPYSLLMADDEIYSPSSLVDCIRFLEVNPQYVASRGECYGWQPQVKKISRIRLYPNIAAANVQAPDPLLRVYQHFIDYTPRYFFSVTKTDVARSFFQAIETYAFVRVFAWAELFYEAYLAALGPCKILPSPYQLRGNLAKVPRHVPVEDIASYIARPEGLHTFESIAKSLSGSFDACCNCYPLSTPPSVFTEAVLFALTTYCNSYLSALSSSRPIFPLSLLSILRRLKRLTLQSRRKLTLQVEDPTLVDLLSLIQ